MNIGDIATRIIRERDLNSTTNSYVKQVIRVVNLSKAVFDANGRPSDKAKFYRLNPVANSMEFDVELRLQRKPLPGRAFVADGGAYTEDKEYAFIQLELTLDPANEPACYNKVVGVMKDIVRHEIEHLTQAGPNRLPQRPRATRSATRNKIAVNRGNAYKYYLLRDEVPAMVVGMNRLARHEKKPLDVVFLEFLEDQKPTKFLTDKEIRLIMKTWIAYARKRLPDALYSDRVAEYEK